MDKTIVIIPAYNEEKNFYYLIEDIKICCNDFDFLLIDDNSEDRTYEIAKKSKIFKEIIRNQKNLGYGGSLIVGFEYAIKNNYNFIITMDADGQHEPRYIYEIRKLLEEYDFVNCSRYHPKSRILTDFPKDRKFVNMVFTKLINEITNFNITDSFCGFRGYRKHLVEKLNLKTTDYAIPCEIWAKFIFLKPKIIEIPIDLIYRDLNKKMPIEDPIKRLSYYLFVFSKTIISFDDSFSALSNK
jgi:glycosyltransferase involved in cell wall biosynthesis